MTDFTQFRLLVIMAAGWISREQAGAIAYLVEENRVLKEQLQASGKRLLLTDDQRRRLAAKGKPLGRKILATIATIVTPDTILRWHRECRNSRIRGTQAMRTEIRNPSAGWPRVAGAGRLRSRNPMSRWWFEFSGRTRSRHLLTSLGARSLIVMPVLLVEWRCRQHQRNHRARVFGTHRDSGLPLSRSGILEPRPEIDAIQRARTQS